MNRYYVKLTAISPIHIGSGEVYEPTNYVIDDGYLYEFDEILFYKNLKLSEQNKLKQHMSDLFRVIAFYKEHKKEAKKIYFNKVKVTKEIVNIYNRQINKDGTLNKNQLHIERILREKNSYLPIIPGSSIKGVFDTFMRIYSTPEVASNEVRQKLKISDALCIKENTEIGKAIRVYKKEINKTVGGIPINVEIINVGSEFIFTIDTHFSKKDIFARITEYFSNSKRNTRAEIKNNSFKIKIGKFSGYEFTAYNPRKTPKTYTVYGNKEFGWIEVVFISEDDYNKLYNEYIKLRDKKILESFNRVKDIQEKIRIEENRRKEEKLKKELQAKKEKEEQERKLREEQEKLSKMSPLDKKIYELQKNNPNQNETIDIIIFNAIKNGELEEFKCEALKRLKEEMIKLKKWVETSKKPQKDKKYKRTQEVITMMKECK